MCESSNRRNELGWNRCEAMSAGPILIFDKSLIEMLSPDEAVWLGQFYRVNIVPVFLVETLADLEKEVAASRIQLGSEP